MDKLHLLFESSIQKNIKMKKLLFLLLATITFTSCKKENVTTTNELTSKTKNDKNSTITDKDGNIYKTITIGTQIWMGENLKVSTYNDGTTIPNVKDMDQWSKLNTGAWVHYRNDTSYNTKYGKFYNWYAVNQTTNGNKNICPTGWHVPSDNEWTILTEYLGGNKVAGGKMKEEGISSWYNPNTGATNSSLFTGLPSGFRDFNGSFAFIGKEGGWWSSTEHDEHADSAWGLDLYYEGNIADRGSYRKNIGMSVRCIKD